MLDGGGGPSKGLSTRTSEDGAGSKHKEGSEARGDLVVKEEELGCDCNGVVGLVGMVARLL